MADGLGFQVAPGQFEAWRALEEQVGETIRWALGEPADPLSSSEHVLLALPFMESPPTSGTEVDETLARFLSFIMDLADAGDEHLLTLIAEYGRRWELIVETELPLGEPATIKVAEDRSLDLGALGTCQHPIALGDAVSYHAEVTIEDAHLEFHGEPTVRSLDGADLGRPPIEGVVFARHALAVYSTRPDRPYYADLKFRLRPTRDLRYASRAVGMLLATALPVALWLDPSASSKGVEAEMSLLVVPTTLAFALLLVREATPMASRLLAVSRGAAVVLMLVLWSVVLLRVTFWSGF